MRPLVLTYHGFGERSPQQDPHNHFVPIEAFTQQIDSLLARGWHALDERAYLDRRALATRASRAFIITIDDGYVSTLAAAEVLAARGVPAIVYIPAGLVGGSSEAWAPEMASEQLLDAGGVRHLVTLGLAVGAHGWDHRPMVGMDDATLQRNTVEARASLADLLGARPASFAYPGGNFDSAAERAVERAGFEAAFAVDQGHGRYAQARVDVNATDTPRSFAMKCSRWWPAARAIGKRVPSLRRRIHVRVGQSR